MPELTSMPAPAKTGLPEVTPPKRQVGLDGRMVPKGKEKKVAAESNGAPEPEVQELETTTRVNERPVVYPEEKVQLCKREKALTERQQGQLDQQFNDSEQPQAANLEAIFANINPGIELPEELEPYRKPLASLAIDVAKQVVQQMQAQAEVQHAHQQKVEMTNKIRTQLREVQNGPRAQDFATHRDAVIALAQESPGLINRIGLSGILSIVAGPGKPQTMPIPNQNEQAASEMLQTLQSRRQAAMQPPSQSPTTATRAVPFTVPQGTSMNDAVAQAFADAQRRHG